MLAGAVLGVCAGGVGAWFVDSGAVGGAAVAGIVYAAGAPVLIGRWERRAGMALLRPVGHTDDTQLYAGPRGSAA